jgi:branched-subunit amino acid aminotransferase/4-amino-4-deoxychorismate lyase
MSIFYEGCFVPEEEAKIPLSDRGFQFGDGAFATIQVRDGVPLFLETHLEQLKKQCLSFNLVMPTVDPESIEELIELNQAHQGIWRLKIFVTGGDGTEGRLPKREGRVVIFLKPFSPLPFKPLKMGTFSIPYYSCHASFKSLAHLNRFYVMEEAYCQGADDCVTLTEKGYILEAAFGNLFWIKEKTLMTPDPALPLYFGVTIKNILKLAQELGFEIKYVKLPLTELPKEAAAFRTNTMQGIRPIAQIGEALFMRHPLIESHFLNGYEHMIEQQKKRQRILA